MILRRIFAANVAIAGNVLDFKGYKGKDSAWPSPQKGFSGSKSSGSNDGGTSSRVFGSFLSWMQEKDQPVLVVATVEVPLIELLGKLFKTLL